MVSPDAAVPRSRNAEYQVDLIGLESAFGRVTPLAGSGTMQADFAKGVVVTNGTMNQGIQAGQTTFSSEAKPASTGNGFSGTFRAEDFGTFTGTLNGSFFGPAAQEVGAAFSATQGDRAVMAGTIIGRGAAVTAVNQSIVAPTLNEFFTNDAVRLTASLPGYDGMNNTLDAFSERSKFNVDFGAATMSADLAIQVRNAGAVVDMGISHFRGGIYATTIDGGTTTVDRGGNIAPGGALKGQFFGPRAGEIGAVFTLEGYKAELGAYAMQGVAIAKRD